MESGRWGRRIRAFRKLKRIQQEELAKQLGIPTAVLGKIERGIKLPSSELMENIAEQLNIDVKELMGEIQFYSSTTKEEDSSDE